MKGIPAAPVTRTRTGSLAIFEEVEGIEQGRLKRGRTVFV
jgi:hypothetical protein